MSVWSSWTNQYHTKSPAHTTEKQSKIFEPFFRYCTAGNTGLDSLEEGYKQGELSKLSIQTQFPQTVQKGGSLSEFKRQKLEFRQMKKAGI